MITRRGLLAGSAGAFAFSVASACGGVSSSKGSGGSGASKGDTGGLSTQGFGKPDDGIATTGRKG